MYLVLEGVDSIGDFIDCGSVDELETGATVDDSETQLNLNLRLPKSK